MIETKEQEINGNIYSVTQMPARRALRMQARLLKLLGPAMSTIFIAGAKDLNSADQSIPKALQYLAEQLDEKTFENLVMDLLEGVRKNNHELKPGAVDLEFAGDLNTLFLLLKFILEVNYSDFFLENGILKVLFQKEEEVTSVIV